MAEITFPCPDKTWQSLEEREDESRFCDLCMKKVFAKNPKAKVYCGVGSEQKNQASYYTFLARFAAILLFCFGSALFTNVQAQTTDSLSTNTQSTINIEATGTVRGYVTDEETEEFLPFSTVMVRQDDKVIGGAQTDFDGLYKIDNLPPGKYSLKVTYLGYKDVLIEDIVIEENKVTFANAKMGNNDHLIVGIVIDVQPRLIDPYNTGTTTFRREEMKRHPN